jgi:4-amino-4-deoxy-L-arabinose transferase-like glycosyltransferase
MQRLIAAGAIFLLATAFLITLAPSAPFTKELGVCESGAVRDVLAGHIILPRFLPGPIVHVPPLYWWLTAALVKALGWNELAFRLPSIFAAALTCVAVFAWSGRTLGLPVGFWSVAALLLCHFFLDAARQPRMDSMLALFVTTAIVSVERAIAEPASGKRCPPWYLIATIAVGLGILTKGILGIVLPGLVVACFLFARGRLSELFSIEMVATFAGGLAIGLAWFIAGYRLGGRPFLEWQVRMNLWSRFIPAGAGGADYCAHQFWYFAPQMLKGFLPWSLYLPAAVLAMWPTAQRPLPEPLIYAICWFAAIFIFFSSSHGKCLIYILPAFSPLSILIGWTIAEFQTGAAAGIWVNRLFSAGSMAIAIGALAMVTAAIGLIDYGIPTNLALRLHSTDRRFLELLVGQGFNARFLFWAGLSAAGIGLVIGGMIGAAINLESFGVLVIASVGGWFWFAVMNPALARGETLKTFAREVDTSVPDGTRIGHFGLSDCELNFYSLRPLEPVSRVSCAENATTDHYIIIRKQDFDAIPMMRRKCFTVELQSTPNDSIGPRLLIRQTDR